MSRNAAWVLFDGWSAAQGVDPFELPWSRFLNLIYHFAVRNASKDKKKEFDQAMQQTTNASALREMAAARKDALSATQIDQKSSGVPEDTSEVKSNRRSRLPPRPVGWGDDETATRESLMVAQSLKVGGKIQ